MLNDSAYDEALRERLLSGGVDCPEERDSVRRWVDAQRVTTQPLCVSCKRTPVDETDGCCRDCFSVFGGDKHAPTRPVAGPPENLIVWSTATDES